MAIFSKTNKILWIILALAAVVFELIPAHYPAGVFVLHNGLKTIVFLLVGFLAPLAFWRFDGLNTGILFSAGSAVLVELLQAVLSNGHRFSLVELGAKLLLMGAGFLIALDVRYERDVAVGRVRIRPAG